MITVLDQYEVEYKESYISGSYDQVVMGKMFYKVQKGGIKKYFYGNRGVVYGNINSQYAQTPGVGDLDASDSASYRLQPYREKAGNCKSVKHICSEERIYDTLLPEVFSCFKINGAHPTILTGTWDQNPAQIPSIPVAPTSIDENNAFLMFNNYTTKTSYSRSKLNVIVDNTWTSSFPFEPRYSNVKRAFRQNFTKIKVKYKTIFSSSLPKPPGPYVESIPTAFQQTRPGIIFGTVGQHPNFTWIGSYNPSPDVIYHHWFSDSSFSKTKNVDILGSLTVTSSLSYTDNMKVLYGFGDGITIHYDNQFINDADPTGYQMRGSKNLPTFRSMKFTNFDISYLTAQKYPTGSVWNTSPVIRGWKYGIYNGLPEYTNAYYRQGCYGQFRDMLEQRTYTCVFNEKQQEMQDPIVNIKFLDQDENLTNPDNTDSQNLSMFATSSLPFFDLTQKNRPENTLYVKNLSLVKLNFDANTNLII